MGEHAMGGLWTHVVPHGYTEVCHSWSITGPLSSRSKISLETDTHKTDSEDLIAHVAIGMENSTMGKTMYW